jgi:NADH:ubiquinone oxidoreductase subunit E
MKEEIKKIKAETNSIVVALQYAMKTDGYISKDAINIIAKVFDISPSEVYSVASFYHQFSFTKKGKNIISICQGTACFVCGAGEILKAVQDRLGITEGEVTSDGKFSVEKNTRCLGKCAGAPVVLINNIFYERATKETIIGVINELERN